MRSARYTFSHWATGDIELYNNDTDPYQLSNAICSVSASWRDKRRDMSAGLSACKANACKTLENRNVL